MVLRVILWLWVVIIFVLFRWCTMPGVAMCHENRIVLDKITICSWIGLFFHCCLSKFLLLAQSFINKNTKHMFWALYRTINYASLVKKYWHSFWTGQQIFFFSLFTRLFLFFLSGNKHPSSSSRVCPWHRTWNDSFIKKQCCTCTQN